MFSAFRGPGCSLKRFLVPQTSFRFKAVFGLITVFGSAGVFLGPALPEHAINTWKDQFKKVVAEAKAELQRKAALLRFRRGAVGRGPADTRRQPVHQSVQADVRRDDGQLQPAQRAHRTEAARAGSG